MASSPRATKPNSRPAADQRLRRLETAMKRHQHRPDALIEVLHTAQELFGYLDAKLLMHVAHSLRLPPSQVYGVATFYHFFSLAPKGVHTCVVCMGTACYVKGAAQMLSTLEQATGIQTGETTPDGQFSLMTARCLGACGIAPTVIFDDQLEGHQTPASSQNALKPASPLLRPRWNESWTFLELRQSQPTPKPHRIRCCTVGGCLSANGLAVKSQLETAVTEAGLDEQVAVSGVGCMGLCSQGPLVQIDPLGDCYRQVTPDQAAKIISTLLSPPATPDSPPPFAPSPFSLLPLSPDLPFFSRQHRIVLENSGQIDPEKIEDYIAAAGYEALHHCLREKQPAAVVDEITRSGLRGRGGAGYPTGLKWATVAKMPPGQKYVVCNADEGDPGAYMDRSVLESDPHRVLEGIAIAAYAVGASQGYIYVRGEYPLAISHLQTAIRQAKHHGLLGSQIFDSPFDFRIDLRIGAGAFVCGEETALMASIEGRRGLPRPRRPPTRLNRGYEAARP